MSGIRSKLISIGAGSLLVACSIFVGVAPANAAQNDCLAGRWCMWNDPNYTGTLKQYNTGSWTVTNIPRVATAVWNRGTVGIRTWDGDNFTGQSRVWGAAAAYNDLRSVNKFGFASWDDSIRCSQAV